MSREIDRRDFSPRRTILNRAAELRSLASAVSDRLPGAHRIHIARLDAATGNPAAVASEAAPAEGGNYVQRAVDHVRGIRLTSPGLAALAGQTAQGNWQLRVKDLAAQDTGKLNRWKLELTL